MKNGSIIFIVSLFINLVAQHMLSTVQLLLSACGWSAAHHNTVSVHVRVCVRMGARVCVLCVCRSFSSSTAVNICSNWPDNLGVMIFENDDYHYCWHYGTFKKNNHTFWFLKRNNETSAYCSQCQIGKRMRRKWCVLLVMNKCFDLINYRLGLRQHTAYCFKNATIHNFNRI